MWNSKDVASVIFMAVLGVVSTALVVQMATLISGIQGANYVFTIIMAVQTSFSLLLYEGRRWRLLAQNAILTLLIMPLYLGGPPFSVTKIQLIATAFVVDLLFNSFYKTFRNSSKLKLWSVLCTLVFYLIMPFFSLLIRTLFYSPEAVALYVNVILLLSPVIIIESAVGGYIGHQIYLRLRHPATSKSTKTRPINEFAGTLDK
jgi:hypothetical protein